MKIKNYALVLVFTLLASCTIQENAEVAPSQWEFQIGPCEGIDAADQLWAARYLLVKMAGEYGYEVLFDPKLKTVSDGDHIADLLDIQNTHDDSSLSEDEDDVTSMPSVNGSGCHTNFSTKTMRTCPTKTRTVCGSESRYNSSQQTEVVEKNPSAIERRPNGVSDYIMKAIECLENVHEEHMMVYGKGNEARMTGNCETARYDKFTYGVGDRGVSVRIPVDVFLNGYGYIEDRRPAANADPYLVTSFIARTVAPAATNKTFNVGSNKINITSNAMAPAEFKTWEEGVFAKAEKKNPLFRERLSEMIEDTANKRAAGAESESARRTMDERFARAHRLCDEDYEIEQNNIKDQTFRDGPPPRQTSRSLSPRRSFAMPTENKLDSVVSSDSDFDETKGESLWEHYNTVVKDGRRLYLDEGRPAPSYYEL